MAPPSAPTYSQVRGGSVVRPRTRLPVEDVPGSGVSCASHRWTPVIGRRARGMVLRELTSSIGLLPHDRGKNLRNGAKDDRVTATQLAREAPVTELRGNKDTRKLKPRPPTTAVVSVTIKPGVKLSYRDVMVEARSKP